MMAVFVFFLVRGRMQIKSYQRIIRALLGTPSYAAQ